MVPSLVQKWVLYYCRKGFFFNAEKLLPLIQERLSWQYVNWERLTLQTFVRFGWRRLTFLVQERLISFPLMLEMLPILTIGISPF